MTLMFWVWVVRLGVSHLDWMSSKDLSAMLSQESRSLRSRSLFMGLSKPGAGGRGSGLALWFPNYTQEGAVIILYRRNLVVGSFVVEL